MEIINQASEKFRDMQDEVCGFLFGILQQLNELETEVFERSEELKLKRPEPHIMAPGEDELWDEYRERIREIVKLCCTEKLYKQRWEMVPRRVLLWVCSRARQVAYQQHKLR